MRLSPKSSASAKHHVVAAWANLVPFVPFIGTRGFAVQTAGRKEKATFCRAKAEPKCADYFATDQRFAPPPPTAKAGNLLRSAKKMFPFRCRGALIIPTAIIINSSAIGRGTLKRQSLVF